MRHRPSSIPLTMTLMSKNVFFRYVDEIEFPAVSFCNLNDMRLSVMEGTMVDRAILDHSILDNVTAEEYRNVTRRAVHKLEEMLVECIFDGQECSHQNFTEFDWMQGDRCFTFNSGKKIWYSLSYVEFFNREQRQWMLQIISTWLTSILNN